MRRGPVDSGYIGELFPFAVEAKHGSEEDQGADSWCWVAGKVCDLSSACPARPTFDMSGESPVLLSGDYGRCKYCFEKLWPQPSVVRKEVVRVTDRFADGC